MDEDDVHYEAARANAVARTLHAALLMFGLGGLLIAWRLVSPEDWPGWNAWVAPALAGALLHGRRLRPRARAADVQARAALRSIVRSSLTASSNWRSWVTSNSVPS